jgi:hypothetical protein
MTPTTSDSDRRMSVSSTATTATSSSVSSSASTIAAPQGISEKQMAYETVEETGGSSKGKKQQQQQQQQQPFDVFEYQAAGYLSMPMDHESQPYRASAWQKTRNITQRRGSKENSEEAEEKKQQREQEYKDLDLEKKTKFGMTEAGMRIVG